MSFFHNLNKTLDSIAAKPEAAQLNERDEGKHNNGKTTGFKAVAAKAAKEYGSKEAGERVAGAVRNKMKKAGKLEEETVDEGLGDIVKNIGGMAKKAGNAVLNKVGHGDNVDMIRDLQRKMGAAPHQQHGKPSMAEPKEGVGRSQGMLEGMGNDITRAHFDAYVNDGMTPQQAAEHMAKELQKYGYDETPEHILSVCSGSTARTPKQRTATALNKAKSTLGGMYEEGDAPMTAKQKSFAKLAPPKDKITFADKIAGAKKEVDEMLGDVAAEAMRNALSGGQKKLDKNKNGKLDANDFAMLRAGQSKKQVADESRDDDDDVYSYQDPAKAKTHKTASGGTVTRHGGVTRHQAAPGHYGGYDPETDPDKDDDKPDAPAGEKRGRGRPKGAPKGPERVTAKAYKHKGGRKMSEEEIQEAISALEECGYSVSPLEEESATKKDNRAEKAGKKVTKDIEYDEKKKDGIHGKKRGAEDDKAEKAGKKVAKDIEYDDKKDEVKEDEPKKSKSKFKFGGSVYEALDAELETLINEGMSVTVNMSQNSEDGHPGNKSITVNADGEDAERLAELLKMAGVGQQSGGCGCGESPCSCDMVDENKPNWPSDTETSDDAFQYSGGVDGPKGTGQSTTPVLASQLRRQVSMEESVKIEKSLFSVWKNYKG